MIKLERLSEQPVVVPDPAKSWERAATFNTAAIYHNGLYQLRYRATDSGCHARSGDYMKANGHAMKGDNKYVYDGGADTVIGVAAMHKSDVRF